MSEPRSPGKTSQKKKPAASPAAGGSAVPAAKTGGNGGKYHRARIRHFLFTVGPNRLSGGRIFRRHLAQETIVREVEVASPRWPRAFDGLRIGHVSDFHLGDLLPLERALAIVDLLKAQEPDLVACTGDVVDLHHDEAGPLLDALAAIGAPLGSALVLGNHDELHCRETVSRLARQAGVTLLQNEMIEAAHNGQRLSIAGIHWAKTVKACRRQIDATCGLGGEAGGGGIADQAASGESLIPQLLLSHNPKAFLRAAELGIPLTLAGHTHGGQVAIRRQAPASKAYSTRQQRAGLFHEGLSRLYVTSGVGAWFPLRINCPSEIAMITMRHAEGPAAASEAVAGAKAGGKSEKGRGRGAAARRRG